MGPNAMRAQPVPSVLLRCSTCRSSFRRRILFAIATGTFVSKAAYQEISWRRITMDGIVYLVGLIVIVMFILSFFGLR